MIWIGLPAYNEEYRIKGLLCDIDKSLSSNPGGYTVVVYDDGSGDGTISQISAARAGGVKVDLVEGGVNKGLGHALSCLIEHCGRNSSAGDIIIIMDADATHNPEHIHRMIGYIRDGFDVVIASRYTHYSRIRGLSWHRRMMSKCANLIFKILFPIRGVADYSCAYRAYTAQILKLAADVYGRDLIEERGFACMAEFLVKLRRLEIIACEVPLILRYDKKAGASKMNVPATVIRTFKMISKFLFMPAIRSEELEKLKEKYGV